MQRTDVKTKDDAIKYAIQRKKEEIDDLRKTQNEIEKDKELEDIEDYRDPLCIDKTFRLTIELSTGGDADGLILEYNKEKELIRGYYYWADWGQYEEIRLTDDEAAMVESVYLGGDASAYLED